MAEPVVIDRTIKRVRREKGGRSWLREFLEYNSPNIVKFEDDFLGDVLDARWDTDAIGSGTAAASVLDTPSGEIKIVTGTGDDEGAELDFGSLAFRGDLYAVMEARVNASALTTVKMEVGFTDAVTDVGGAVLVLATPTYTATDCALWCLDADDSGNATGWQGIGVKNGTGITKLEPSGFDPVANTYQTLVVALRDDAARYMIRDANDAEVYDSGWQAAAVTKTVKLTPWIFCIARAASASKNMVIDYVNVWQRRTTSD